MALNFLNNGYFAAKVGIGTESPGEKLAVKGDASYIEITHPTATSYSGIKFSEGGTPQGSIQNIGSTFATVARRGNFEIFHNTGGDLTLQHSGGNVGIGITTPQAPLSFANVAGNKIDFYYDTTSNDRYGIQVQASELRIHSGAAGQSTGGITFGKDDGTTFTEAMRIRNDGKVGIGTTGPNAKLEVNDTNKAINTKGNLFVATTDTLAADKGGQISLGGVWSGTSQIQFAGIAGRKENATSGNAGGYLQLSTTASSGGALTERMRITSAGGISFGSTGTAYGGVGQILKSNGNASPTWIDGSAIPGVPGGSGTLNTVAMWTPDGDTLGNSPITISGNNSTFAGTVLFNDHTTHPDQVNSYFGTGNDASIQHNGSHLFIDNSVGSSYIRNTSTGDILLRNSTGGDIQFDNEFAGNILFNTSNVERMRIDSSGNVGIGTSPNSYSNYTTLTIGNASGTGSILDIEYQTIRTLSVYAASNGGNINVIAAKPLILLTSGAERMRILATGQIGMGTTGPTEKLEVVGNIKITAAVLSNQENADVDTGTETVAEFSASAFTAGFFDFVIKKTTNVRSGTVYACHDGTTVQFTETSTQDLGDTSDVTLSVDISGGNMRLRATTTSDDWSIKSLIRAI